MKLEYIIEEALTYTYKDKITKKTYIQPPHYEIKKDIIHIYTPVIPYKLVVLRRLLNITHYDIKNIIIGKPDV